MEGPSCDWTEDIVARKASRLKSNMEYVNDEAPYIITDLAGSILCRTYLVRDGWLSRKELDRRGHVPHAACIGLSCGHA